MVMGSRGHHALAMALVGSFAGPAQAQEWPGLVVVGHGEAAQWSSEDGVLNVSADKAYGVRIFPRGTFDAESTTIIHEGVGGPRERAYSILAHDGAEASLSGSRIEVHAQATTAIHAQRGAIVDLDDSAVVMSSTAGIRSTALAMEGAVATLRRSSIEAGRAQAINTRFADRGPSRVMLEDSTIQGRIDSGETGLRIDSIRSDIEGDIVRGGSGPLEMHMRRGTWRGKAGRLSELSLEDSLWTVTTDSDVASLRLDRGGRVAFDSESPGFRTLRVGGWQAGDGASGVQLRSRLDAGGMPHRQGTDRLLVSGDASGTTPIHVVNVGGHGASTAGRDGVNGPGDGISLVQVGGEATGESFRLVGDYVAVGAWQYRLRAFEPGRSDAKQRMLDGKGGDFWDFRLQSARVEERGTSSRDADATDATTRVALAPQVPAYLVLAQALFGYGTTSLDALRPVELDPARDPAWRVRVFGGNVAYRSTLPFGDYGIDYKRHDRGMQVAGDLLVHAVGGTTLRPGLAASVGGTRVSPDAPDGQSEARVDARGLAWYTVLTTESDWRVASIYAITHYRVAVRTPWRGEVLGRLRANANDASFSAMYRWRPATRLLIEPGASVAWQRLRFSRATDGDGIDIRAGTPERVTLRGGAKASLSFMPKGQVLYAWSPFVDLRYVITRGSGESIWLSGERLATGRATRAIELSTGARFHLWSRVTTYVDVSSRMRAGRYGESGFGARAGFALAL